MALNALRRPTATDEEPSYLVSVSDLMVGMLFIFIIILMAFALNFRVAQDDATRIEADLVRERDAVNAEKDRLAREREAQRCAEKRSATDERRLHVGFAPTCLSAAKARAAATSPR